MLEDDRDLTSRTDVRTEEKAALARAKAVVASILKQPAESWDDLPLDDAVVDSLNEYSRIGGKRHKARKRLADRMAREVRQTNLDELEFAVGLGEAARSAKDQALMDLEDWRQRLILDGDGALDAFVDAHPTADRQRLRQLVRQAKKDPKGKAFRTLFGLLREATGV